jgi:hypothetical protein
MTDNTVKHLASTAMSTVSGLVQDWTHELHAMNDNEGPDPPPAIAARTPRELPFTAVEARSVEVAAA